MAKKKKTRRKQNFAYARPTGSAQISAPLNATASEQAPARVATPKPQTDELIDLAVVRSDLKQILRLVLGFIALELILWYLLQHSSFGAHFYNLFK